MMEKCTQTSHTQIRERETAATRPHCVQNYTVPVTYYTSNREGERERERRKGRREVGGMMKNAHRHRTHRYEGVQIKPSKLQPKPYCFQTDKYIIKPSYHINAAPKMIDILYQ